MSNTMNNCILCGEAKVVRFLDLGSTALANKFVAAEDLHRTEATFPLRVGFCSECHHVQLTDDVPPTALFDDYLYISSMSDTLVQHLHGLSDTVVKRFRLGPNDLVTDVGCNDGTLLRGFARHGVKVLGIEPAQNLARLSQRAGLPVVVDYFGADTANRLWAAHGAAKVITLTNVFPHLPFLNDFMQGVNTFLAPDGALVIEAHYLRDLLEQRAFDTVYHEHVSYWALAPMAWLFARHGFEIVDVERLPVHHGQVRVFAQRKGVGTISPNVTRLMAEEKAAGMDRLATFQRFANEVLDLKTQLDDQIARIRSEGKTVVAYGAPAKGSTLLSYFGIGPDRIRYIADKSPLKQGRYTPGTHIPVVGPEKLIEDQPDYVLLLAWNFAEEIMEQQAAYRARGGRFIIPVPEVRVV